MKNGFKAQGFQPLADGFNLEVEVSKDLKKARFRILGNVTCWYELKFDREEKRFYCIDSILGKQYMDNYKSYK